MKLKASISRHYSTFSASTNNTQQLSINIAKALHAHLIKTNQHKHTNSSLSQILKTYTSSSKLLHKAKLIFDNIENPNLTIFNYMIRGFSQNQSPIEALQIYKRLCGENLRGNCMTFVYVIKACGRVSDIFCGEVVHGHVVKLGFGGDLFVNNGLVYVYGVSGEIGNACKVFDEMGERDLVSWNSLVCGFGKWGKFREVLGLFERMRVENVRADAVTLVKVLLACRCLGEWEKADYVVGYMRENCVEIDVYLGNTLIDVYGQRGMVSLAEEVFYVMQEKNVVSWNSMLMVYVKARNLVAARMLFNEMLRKDVVSWTSMITGYVQAHQFDEAVRLFREMMGAQIRPDKITVASVLCACAHLGSLDVGVAVHDYIRKHGIVEDIYVGNSLIDMYCKCGVVEKALEVFHEMNEKDSVSYTAMISGLAVNGGAENALELFSNMLRESIQPTQGTFVGILLACAHAGLVDKGLEYFENMQKVYNLMPEMKHYGCVVNLLSRSGNLDRAYKFINEMPMIPDVAIWRILLSACEVHKNMVLAEIVQRKLLNLDPHNSGNYVILCNAYAGSDRWDDAMRMRVLMEESNVQKPSAWSSIEVI